jgi:DNA-binding transcriptional LysR family regulator
MIELPPSLLKTFVVSVETMSFSKTASIVNKSPATVSMQIAKLEERLDTVLFIRDTRNLRLTPSGEEFYGYANRLSRLHDEAVESIRRPDIAGSVSIGAPDDYITGILPPVLRRFGALFLKVELDVICEQTTALIPKVNAGELDLAIITRTAGTTGVSLRKEPMVWISSKNKEALDRTPLPVALYETGSEARSIAISALSKSNVRYRVAYTSSSHAALLAIVEAGLAVAAVAEMAAPKKLSKLDQSDGLPPIQSLDVELIRSAGSHRPPCDALAEAFFSSTQTVL